MAVLQMKKVLICALKKDRKAVLEFLQRKGTLEICADQDYDEVFKSEDKSASMRIFVKNADKADDALRILNEYNPEKKKLTEALEGRKEVTEEEFSECIATQNETIALCDELIALERDVAETHAQIVKKESDRIALEPWEKLDIPLNCSGTKKTSIFIGSVSSEMTLDMLYTKFAEISPDLDDVYIELISSSPEQTCFMVVTDKSDRDKAGDILRQLNYTRAPSSDKKPSEEIQDIDSDIKLLRKKADDDIKKIRESSEYRSKIRMASDYYRIRAQKYEVLSTLAQSKKTFLIKGYIPERDSAKFKKELEKKFDISVELNDPTDEDKIPTELSNDAFSAPVESIVESYSMPSRGEIDPSKLVSLFYYVLFGMMLSDAAYGLIIVTVCGICLKKFKNMENSMRKALTMFLYCGISTVFWGIMFGSFFGDAVNVIATTFFNRPDISLPALWFEPLNKPMKMLAFCFAIGIVHLMTGLGAKLYSCLKSGSIKDAIYDCVFWYMLVLGAIVYMMKIEMFTSMLSIPFTVPETVGNVAGILAIIGGIGIILTGGRSSKNWFKRILKGLYSFYGITGYLSDILSYSRLLALGLATSVIATVFNKMGSMLGNTPVGVALFIIVFLMGHTLNLLINALGAYVHTNRLQFVEFFGKFYEGGGTKFNPFGINTKYYKFKEEKENG
jgi:V/A-type H+-transporting ATPase subunit I